MSTTLEARSPAPGPTTVVAASDAPARTAPRWPIVTLLALVAVAIVIASRWGESLLAAGVRMQINTPPLTGSLDWRPGLSALPAVLVAGSTVAALPALARRLGWARLLVVTFAAALGWAVALALVDGRDALTVPLLSNQYLRTATQIGDPGEFLRTFIHRLPTYNIHTQGHPPGMVMVLWGMDRLGLGGVGWNAALVMAGGAFGVVATLVGVREVAGEATARAAAPFLVLAPAAIWWTSGDAFFAGVGATAVTVLVVATGRSGRRSDLLAASAGLLFAFVAFLSYGLVLLALIPVAVAAARRRWRPVAIAAAVACACVLAVAGLTGFAWWDGLVATRARYFAGVAHRRPYGYFLLADLAVFALMIGPAAIAGLTRLRRSRLLCLVGGAVTVVLLADLSGMSKAEVERIWIPFVPWVVVAGALVPAARRGAVRLWLGSQVVLALVLAVAVRSPW